MSYNKLHVLEQEVRSNDLRLDTLERASHTLSLMHPPRQYFTESQDKETRDKFELLRCWMEYRLADGRLT